FSFRLKAGLQPLTPAATSGLFKRPVLRSGRRHPSRGGGSMRPAARRFRAPLLLTLACLALGLSGCPSAREDRTITWSPDGKAASFQQGQDGAFIADETGGGLTKIFQPGPDVLAASAPLWSPDGKRLIFTTARAAQAPPPVNPPPSREPPP